jgi:hypothetical protein
MPHQNRAGDTAMTTNLFPPERNERSAVDFLTLIMKGKDFMKSEFIFFEETSWREITLFSIIAPIPD